MNEKERKGCGSFTFSWTKEEEEAIRKKAAKLNLSVSAYLKFAAMNFHCQFKALEFEYKFEK